RKTTWSAPTNGELMMVTSDRMYTKCTSATYEVRSTPSRTVLTRGTILGSGPSSHAISTTHLKTTRGGAHASILALLRTDPRLREARECAGTWAPAKLPW